MPAPAPVLLRAPSGVTGVVAGLANNISPNSQGLYSSSDYREIQALMAAGWVPSVIPAVDPEQIVALTGVNPSATSATYGTPQNINPPSSYQTLSLQSLDIVFGGTFNSETVTVQIIPSYSDGTTGTGITKTATATGTTSLALADIRALNKTNAYITKLAISSKSTINSSAVTVAINASTSSAV